METGASSVAPPAMAPGGGEKQSSPGSGQTSASSAAGTQKTASMSMVGPDFVIPKSKAMVPVARTTTKWEPLEPKKEEPKPPSRKTKWGPDLTEDPAVKRGRALAYQTRAEQLAAQLESNNLEIDYNEGTRSPSPPPIYDSMGHRMNTREGRKRDRLDVERRDAIGECMKLNPFYKPPFGYRPVLKESKLFIPAKENPGYNFIGLILGPRGNTQKRLEAETGCRITIRGKGSIKDGKTVPYRHGKDNDGMSEELHVHIAAETYEKVDAAVAIIEPLLIPVDEERNIYKMKQLRELAEMNGTVFDLRRICTLCGEEGHRDWQCPKDKLQTFQAKVICRLCGDGSHPTMDCPLKLSGQGKAIDKEYLNFLEELGVGLGGIDPAVKSDSDNHAGGSGTDTSQPMLLTAAGALPLPAKWMEGFNEFNRRMAAAGNEAGGFPRFPFPFPFPPPGPQALRFLAPFFNPSFFELFKNRPFPPPLPMMAFMLSAFRGRFPFPPPGFRPDMMRPPMPPSAAPENVSSTMPMDIPSSGQGQRSDFTGEGAAQNNPEGFPPSSDTINEYQQQHTVASSMTPGEFEQQQTVGGSSAEAPMFPLPSASHLESRPRSPPAPVPVPVPIPVPAPVPAFSPVQSTDAELLLSGLPVSPAVPPPFLPSVRPIPSIRPVIPPVLQPPTFTPVVASGFAPTIGGPLGVGSTSLSSVDTQSVPPQRWNSWSEGQSSSTYHSEKPAPEFTAASVFSTSGTLGPLPPRMDSPYTFNAGESRPYPSDAPFPSSHRPNVPIHFGSYAARSVSLGVSTVPPSYISNPLQSLPNEFGMVGENQPKSYSLSYPDSRLALPSQMGPQHQPVGSMHSEDYSSFTPPSQRSTPGLVARASSVSHPAHAYRHNSSFLPSELPYSRTHEPLHTASADVHMPANYRNTDMYHSGAADDGYHSGGRPPFASSLDKEFRSTSSAPFERNYRYEPSVPPHILQQNTRSPWSMDLLSRPGSSVQQTRGQQEIGGGNWLRPNAQNAASRSSIQDADPEYEKLMSSVGVL